jgi:hypothetical protein
LAREEYEGDQTPHSTTTLSAGDLTEVIDPIQVQPRDRRFHTQCGKSGFVVRGVVRGVVRSAALRGRMRADDRGQVLSELLHRTQAPRIGKRRRDAPKAGMGGDS